MTLVLVILALTVCALMFGASAADLEWNLLTDTEAGYRVFDMHKAYDMGTEADGTPYVKSHKAGGLYIYDDNNILGSYRTFSLEGDFYFSGFPQGLREYTYTPDERPISFLSWLYAAPGATSASTFNAIRLDSQGYIHTDANGTGKTDVKLETGRWYNIRCVFTPQTGISEMFIDGKKVLDFSIVRFRPTKHVSFAVRYFDGYFTDWGVTMKNLKVKTDSEYTVELKREDAADYLGHQVTKPEMGGFNVRAILGVNSTEYNRIGFETIMVMPDEDGNIISDTVSLKSKVVYESVNGDGKTYNVKNEFGYNYAAALEIEDLPVEPIGNCFELVIRPYVLGMDGMRRYGVATVLFYNGETDESGYPVLKPQTGKSYSAKVTDDTLIYSASGFDTKDYSKDQSMMIRNVGGVNDPLFRAVYLKFTLDEKMVKALESAASATLRFYVTKNETNADRKQYDLMVHGAGTDWVESELNYKNHAAKAMTYEMIHQGPYEAGSHYAVDVLNYLREAPLNDDGTVTVAFRVTTEAQKDVLLTYIASKESNTAATIEISSTMYELTLNYSKTGNTGYEPWGYAEHLTDEWFDKLVDEIYPKDASGEPIYYDIEDLDLNGYGGTTAKGDFTREFKWKNGTVWSSNAADGFKVKDTEWQTAKFGRTLNTLGQSTANRFLDSSYAKEISEYDVYGGITNAGFKGQATGFFHTEKLQGRTYIIDPLGNPYFAVGMNTVVLGDTTNHKEFSLAKFGTEEEYFKQITASLKDTGINTVFVSTHEALLGVENGLNCAISIGVVNKYMSFLGRSQIKEGVYPYNNTINVFDPDFVKITNQNVPAIITEGGYADNPRVFGYTTDNELPSGNDILFRYLTLDPMEDPTNAFSYALAWTWLARRMDDSYPTLDKFSAHPEREQMNSEFLCFVYARFYRVAREAIESVDKNHMYFGSRINGTCYTDEGYHRAAGRYLDIITANLYGGLNPKVDTIIGLYRNSGKPFIVTEFFAKGMDAIDTHGYKLANSTGAGILVQTQQDRADYYEHYTMTLLQSKACVGWTWYRYRDNDQGVYATGSSSTPLIMLHMTYGEVSKANTFLNTETGEILTAQQVGGNYRTLYKGEALASNQNVNKGIYNGDFSSVVTVYQYDAKGKLIDSMGYEVETPSSEHPKDGEVLKALDGGASYTIGTVTNADGTVTKTVLTAYEGKYVAFADSIRKISDHVMGLVKYFDAQ